MRRVLTLLFFLPLLASTQNAVLPPTMHVPFLDNNGKPLSGGQIFFCVAHTLCPGNPLATYTDSTATVQNPNPVPLDYTGWKSIWLKPGFAYHIVARNSTGQQLWTLDDIKNDALSYVQLLGQPNGIATLDGQGHVPEVQLNYLNGGPASINRTIASKLREIPLSAFDFSGSDIGDRVNHAEASCVAGPSVSCNVSLPSGQTFSYSTPIVIGNDVTTLDCQGSTLNYTGAANTDAITVQSAIGPVPYYSGGIKNCFVTGPGTATGVTGIHQQSRIGFVYENVGVKGFHAAGNACMSFENMSGVTTFNEQNTLRKVDLNDCTTHIRLWRNGGTDSFQYNNFDDVHLDVEDAQVGLWLDGPGSSFPSLSIFGGHFNLRFNINSASVAATAIKLSGGADWERSEVNITGEQTSGATMSHMLSVDATSFLYVYGNMFLAGTNNVIAGSAGSVVVHPSLNLNGAVHYEPSQVVLQQRHCKYDLGPNDATFWIANYGGSPSEDNCSFQIFGRNTDDTNKDVDIQGSGSAPVNILFADAYKKFVGIGPGFSRTSPPLATLQVNGGIWMSSTGNDDLTLGGGTNKGVHINFPILNGDVSMKIVVNAGNTTSTPFTFARPWANLPNCVASPNQLVTIGASFSTPTAWAINPTLTSVQVLQGISTGTDVTYFVHCIGNPN